MHPWDTHFDYIQVTNSSEDKALVKNHVLNEKSSGNLLGFNGNNHLPLSIQWKYEKNLKFKFKFEMWAISFLCKYNSSGGTTNFLWGRRKCVVRCLIFVVDVSLLVLRIGMTVWRLTNKLLIVLCPTHIPGMTLVIYSLRHRVLSYWSRNLPLRCANEDYWKLLLSRAGWVT